MTEEEAGPVVVHSADIVVPIRSAPIKNGAVATRDGVVIGVGSRLSLVQQYVGAEESRWNGVLMPGLVNAHTHLQYHGLADLGRSDFADFEAWSVAFDERYSSIQEAEDWGLAARQGAEQALRAGTTTIADICTDVGAADALPDTGLSGVTYFEALGHAAADWWGAERDEFILTVKTLAAKATLGFSIGISPHAPYSLDTEVLADLAVTSRGEGMRIHTHLAESEFEDGYYKTGTGQLADFVAGFGRRFKILADGGAGKSSAEFAHELGLLGPDCHIAHGIYLGAQDRAILREQQTAVALCPRSNQVIGLDPAPVAAYLREGNRICVGTDSLSSTPSLDLLEDVRALRDLALEQDYREPDLEARLLRAATIDGARALGMDTGPYRVGAIELGRRADFAVFGIDTCVESVEAELVESGAGKCIGVVSGGIPRFGAD